jgi:ferredoxin
MATKIPGIFAAGDAARPGAPMVNAIAEGRRAAVSIDRYLRGEDLAAERSLEKVIPVEVNLNEIDVPPAERQPIPCLLHKFRVGNFEEVELGYTTKMAVKEAKRCLNCAGCSECLECERACELQAIDHNMIARQIELEVDAIAIRENPDAQLWDAEGSGLAIRHSGIYTIPSSPDGELSPASAIASRIMVDLVKRHTSDREYHPVTPDTVKKGILKPIYNDDRGQSTPGSAEPRVGILVCDCGGSIGEVIDVPNVVEYCQGLDGTVLSRQVGYACTGETAREIEDLTSQHDLTHIVLAACSCCNLDQICFSCSDRRLQCKSNLLGSNQSDNIHYEFVNIREHCAWVHPHQAEAATAKAKSLIRAGLARTRESQPLTKKNITVERSVLVVGGSISGMRAAADLDAQGFQTILIRKHEPDRKPSGEFESARQKLERELTSQGTMILNGAELVNIAGPAGRYQASVTQNGKSRRFTVGAIILDIATGINGQKDSVLTEEIELPPLLLKAIRNGDKPLVAGQPGTEPVVSQLPGVFLCGTGQAAINVAEALIQGSAAASKASVLLNKGTIDIEQTVATIDQSRCRGCGTCESVCGFGAITLTERIPGIFSAQVDEGLCQGCGICVAHCPSGALSQNGYSDLQISASLEAILA